MATNVDGADEFFAAMDAVPVIATPDEALANAYELLLVGLHFGEAVSAGRISPESFVQKLIMHTGDPGAPDDPTITIEHKYKPETFPGVTWNAQMALFGMSAIAAHDAFAEVFKPNDPNDTSEVGSVRAILYAIRCAFAHGAFAPRWACHKYLRTYRVDVPAGTRTISIVFDGAACHGKPFVLTHIGGWEGYLALLIRARQLVRARLQAPATTACPAEARDRLASATVRPSGPGNKSTR